jgi:carboxypeptidase PM20D1
MTRTSKRVVAAAAVAILALSGVAGFRAGTLPDPRVAVEPVALPQLDADDLARRLAGALRYPTLSWGVDDPRFDADAFTALRAYLEAEFPLAHGTLQRETVSEHSLLFTWAGSEPSLPPLLLLGHMDVVPVEDVTRDDWTHGAFDGVIADGFIWGRGALDNKLTVLGVLQAVEQLIGDGFVPRRTVILAFGHDEEVGGARGARVMAALLEERGVRPALVVDEGGFIGDGLLPGITEPVALVGVAEKGFLSLELIARSEGGHSSMPPRETAVGILAGALHRLETTQFPAQLDGVSRAMFETLAPAMGTAPRVAIANLWLTQPLLKRQLLATPSTAAMLRTTIAPTMLEASPKDNVLASQARAVVNFRVHPSENIALVTDRVRSIIGDERIEIRPLDSFQVEPSPVSPSTGPAFDVLRRSIRQVAGDAIVTPYLVMGGTDARHYTRISDNVFRFGGVRIGPDDVPRLHGTDERVAVDEYLRVVQFYMRLIRNVDAAERLQ